ncbi:MAG TPA: alpha/beta hydrolase [Candidatus Paceibacterota bacterium]|nr:alpha/beta hydrolase [Candidatus Paceibacterota bacterium]
MTDAAHHNEKSLEAQFDRPEIITHAGIRIGVHDVSPQKLKTPIPVALGVGWSLRPRAYRETILELARRGRRVICVDAPHGVRASLKAPYPRVELGKAEVLIEALSHKKIGRVDMIAHSEAAIYMVVAATLWPEKFRNIVLVNAAGVIGKDSMPKLIVRFLFDLSVEFVYALKTKIARGFVRMLGIGHTMKESDTSLRKATSFGKPTRTIFTGLIQSVESMYAIAHADLRGMLQNLKNKGVGIAFIHATGDRTFPIKKVRRAATDKISHAFYTAPGTHQSITLNPKHYASLIDHALDELEKGHVS